MTVSVMSASDESVTESQPLAARAAALVRASARKSFDPFVAIDWSVPFDDSRYYLPPECLPLYGSEPWDGMSERQRIAYSRHEVAALCGMGIWLENILMRLVIDRLYALEPTDATLRYLLVEVGDECRHSAMFSELVQRAGTPAYRPPRKARLLGRFVRSAYSGTSAFLAILAAEELLDVINRETARDKALHPVSREVARIHVVEEARHVSFAKTFLEQALPRLGPVRRGVLRTLAPFTADVIAGATVNPHVFRTLGIRDGAAMARTNPNHRRFVVHALARLVDFLERVTVITPQNRPLWENLGLADARLPRPRTVPGIVAPAIAFAPGAGR
jgi:hypothetical protein